MPSELITDKTLVPWYRKPWFGVLSLLFMWPLALALMWTGPTYYLARGGYKRLGKISKTALSIIQILLVVIYGAKFLSSDQGVSSASSSGNDSPPAALSSLSAPNMQVREMPLVGGISVIVTANDDEPFTVQRIVVNGRKGETGCDSSIARDDYKDPDSTRGIYDRAKWWKDRVEMMAWWSDQVDRLKWRGALLSLAVTQPASGRSEYLRQIGKNAP